MKIIIDRNEEEGQKAIVTIDTKNCHYAYAIRSSLELALRLDGYTEETIDDVFCKSSDQNLKKQEIDENSDLPEKI